MGTEVTDDKVRRSAEALSDLLTMLGVDPDERPEHGGPTTGEVLARAALNAAARAGEAVDRKVLARVRAFLDVYERQHPGHPIADDLRTVLVLAARGDTETPRTAANVLREHQANGYSLDPEAETVECCTCGLSGRDHYQHQADMLAAAGLLAVVQQ